MRPFYKLLLTLTCLFILNSSKTHAITITGHFSKDSCLTAGNVVTMNITVSQASTGLSFTTYFGDGTFSTSPILQTFGTTAHVYSLPGIYTVKHILDLNGVPIDSVQFQVTITACKYIYLDVYNDANSNCTHDLAEGLVYTPVLFEIDSAGHKDTVSVYGSRFLPVYQGMPYTFKMLTTPLGATTTCPASGAITQTVPSTTGTVHIPFGVQCGSSSAFDLNIAQIKGLYRPVSYSYLQVYAANASCSPKSGTVTVTFSNKFSYFSASPTPASVSGNTVTWNFSNMTSSTFGYFGIVLTPATTITLGDTICATAIVTPMTGDVLTANNSATRCDTVVSSFDPNEKEVSPAGAIMAGTKLSYTLNFENLGSDTAFNIYILDTLSGNLDVNSFEMVSSSHAATASIIQEANNMNILRFDFADIKLPHPATSDQNKGFVKFTIHAKPGLPQLTQIPNSAGIYFDINPVIMTNTVTNWIAPISVDDVANLKHHVVYPNPANETLTIAFDKGLYHTARIMNTVGQLSSVHKLTGGETIIDVSQLVPGIYFLHLSGEHGTAVERIEKQ